MIPETSVRFLNTPEISCIKIVSLQFFARNGTLDVMVHLIVHSTWSFFHCHWSSLFLGDYLEPLKDLRMLAQLS